MPNTLFIAPTANYWSTTLNGAVNDSVQTITLNSVTNLQAPGVLVIDRQDGSGTNTPNAREVISFTGISGSDITGVTRAFDNSTARSHSNGALVEAIPTVGMWNNLATIVASHVDTSTGNIVTGSNATVNALLTATRLATSSVASITRVESLNYAGMQGAFTWTKSGALTTSLITSTSPMQLLRATKNLSLITTWYSVQSAPSTAPAMLDIQWASGPTGTFASIFSTKPFIDIGEYTITSAATPGVLSLTSLASGIVIKPEILQPGGAGELTVSLIGRER